MATVYYKNAGTYTPLTYKDVDAAPLNHIHNVSMIDNFPVSKGGYYDKSGDMTGHTGLLNNYVFDDYGSGSAVSRNVILPNEMRNSGVWYASADTNFGNPQPKDATSHETANATYVSHGGIPGISQGGTGVTEHKRLLELGCRTFKPDSSNKIKLFMPYIDCLGKLYNAYNFCFALQLQILIPYTITNIEFVQGWYTIRQNGGCYLFGTDNKPSAYVRNEVVNSTTEGFNANISNCGNYTGHIWAKRTSATSQTTANGNYVGVTNMPGIIHFEGLVLELTVS